MKRNNIHIRRKKIQKKLEVNKGKAKIKLQKETLLKWDYN